MGILKQSTAITVLVGPILDSTGAAKTDEVVGSIKLTKNGTVGAANGSATLTHDHAGKYKLALTTSDTDTVGLLEISLNSGTNDMAIQRFNVIETAVYDALFADGAAGYQVPIWAAANSTVNLSGTTIKTATDVETDTADIQTRLPAALVSGRIDASVGAMAANTLTASALATDAVTEIQSGLSTLDAAGVRSAVGLASANLDTQLADLPTVAEFEARTILAASYATAANQTTIAAYIDTEVASILAAVDTEVAAIKAKTDNLPSAPAATGDIPTVSQIWTTALTEAYRSTGSTGTAAQLLYEILQNITEFAISSTTKTVKKLDGSTTAKTYTLDSASAPTSITEAT